MTTRRTLAAALVLAASASLCPLPATASAAVELEKTHGPLSPLLAELAKPALRAKSPEGQARALGLAAEGPGSLIRTGNRVLVDVTFDDGAIDSLPDLRRAGAAVVAASKSLQTVTARVSPGDLRALASVPNVASVVQVPAPVVRGFTECEGGSVVSEGVQQLNVQAARQAASVEGKGVTVGVLSDSFDQATHASIGGQIATTAEDDVASKDLPGAGNSCEDQNIGVQVLRPFEPDPTEPEESSDEGRAMLQIVHDVAPKAGLRFDSAFNGETAFKEGIEELASLGAKVIVDDVGYFTEPFFQDGPIATAIEKVSGEGVTYLSAAGNDNLFDEEGNQISSWEAPAYRDSGSCPREVRELPGFNATHCLDFDSEAPTDRTFGIEVEAGETLTVDLQWAEPWFGVSTDLDAFLLDADGRLLTGSANKNNLTKKPVEIVQWINEDAEPQVVQLVVNKFGGTLAAPLKFILLENGGGVARTEYPKSGGGDVVGPAVYGHAGSASAVTVGAVPYDESDEAEVFSSRGPATHYFEPVTGTMPAAQIPTQVISKPDLAATDCGATTFFAFHFPNDPAWRFCGTSAAAPHVAGVAALLFQASGSLASPMQIHEALTGSAVPVGPHGPCDVGSGLVESLEAVKVIKKESLPQPTQECAAPSAAGQTFRAPGEWGLEEPPEPEPEPDPEPEPQPQPEPQPEPQPVPQSAPDVPTQPPSGGPPVSPDTTTSPSITRPRTLIRQHPRKVVRTRRALARVVFRFAARPRAVAFRCQFDGSRWRRCGARVVRWFGLGPHVVRVQARGGDGALDPSPAVFRFRVARVVRAAHASHRALRR